VERILLFLLPVVTVTSTSTGSLTLECIVPNCNTTRQGQVCTYLFFSQLRLGDENMFRGTIRVVRRILIWTPRSDLRRTVALRDYSHRPSSSSNDSPRALASVWKEFEGSHGIQIQSLPEVKAVEQLRQFLLQKVRLHGTTTTTTTTTASSNDSRNKHHHDIKSYKNILEKSDHLLSMDAALATFSLHVHARIASLVGHGFYTIGPCGEEILGAGAMTFQAQDSTALHYRHTAMSLARQLKAGDKSMEDLLLGRARGYTVSRLDPVTGGVHCSIGGGPNEFIVTSTLASQCPSAVGRALGYSLLSQQKIMDTTTTAGRQSSSNTPQKLSSSPAVSFVTIGDGSMHNHHFLSSFTLARHAKHLKIKCPLVMGISDNGLSISYETKGYVDTVFGKTISGNNWNDPLIPVFSVDSQDMQSVYDQTKQAMDYARQYQSPCMLLYGNIIRRFGHAATDRQDAYLEESRIQTMRETCVLERAIYDAVERWNVTTYGEMLDRFEEIHFGHANQAFEQAMQEPKVTLPEMIHRVSVPLAVVDKKITHRQHDDDSQVDEKPQVMRKHMTRFYDEILTTNRCAVYVGEDVRHGGYYLVTEGLSEKYPNRVLDFPPDETTLLGAGLGFSQLGLLPIVEIPYAKYLDCGADMFYEIAIQNWLSPPGDSNPIQRGMIIRLQGFDRGLFGGNFHTHNMLSHIPPGMDVLCYSNGQDYVKGMRYALHQAMAGRIIMVVDCTHLLNLRHINDKDRAWEFPYPIDENDFMTFDQIRKYQVDGHDRKASKAIVTYGNGVVTALQTRRDLVIEGILDDESQLDIIDSPYLSGVSTELEVAMKDYPQGVLFADICKEGPGSNVFSSTIMALQERKSLPERWAFCGAPRTYNPLGSTVTFLNRDTIKAAYIKHLT